MHHTQTQYFIQWIGYRQHHTHVQSHTLTHTHTHIHEYLPLSRCPQLYVKAWAHPDFTTKGWVSSLNWSALFRELQLPCTCTTTGKKLQNYSPHAKQEELLFTVYVGDHQWVDSVSMTWLCRWCVLCRGGGVWRSGSGALKMCMFLFPVCIPKQEVEPNLRWVDFIGLWICLPACVHMLQHVNVRAVIFENVFSFASTSRSRHQPGNSEKTFDVRCGGLSVAERCAEIISAAV